MTKHTDKENEQGSQSNVQVLAKIDNVNKPASEIKREKPSRNEPSEPFTEDTEVPTNDARYVKFGIIFLLLTLG
ncbi:MAG: hypothetical protein VXY99_01140, partial [Pseudomonadota bacterium]|nr:hypothetical protein [Pseudomonadota bacterium]